MNDIFEATEKAWREMTAYPCPDFDKPSFGRGFEYGAWWKKRQEDEKITNNQHKLILLLGDLTKVYQSLTSTLGNTEDTNNLKSCIEWLHKFIHTDLVNGSNQCTIKSISGKV